MRTNKIVKAIVAFATIGGLAFMAAPAYADDAEGITETVPATAVPLSTVASDEEVLTALTALVGTQTQEEIAEIMESGPSYSLAGDSEYLAAIPKVESWATRAISVRGPGCATGDACANSVNGYYGTGNRNINLLAVTKVYAGSAKTTWEEDYNFKWGQQAGATTYFNGPKHLTKITRG